MGEREANNAVGRRHNLNNCSILFRGRLRPDSERIKLITLGETP
jgi:hypothetical protein